MNDKILFSKKAIEDITQRLNSLLGGLDIKSKDMLLCPATGNTMYARGCGDGTCSTNCSGTCRGNAYDSFIKHGCGDSTCANTCWGNATR